MKFDDFSSSSWSTLLDQGRTIMSTSTSPNHSVVDNDSDYEVVDDHDPPPIVKITMVFPDLDDSDGSDDSSDDDSDEEADDPVSKPVISRSRLRRRAENVQVTSKTTRKTRTKPPPVPPSTASAPPTTEANTDEEPAPK